MKKMKLDIQLFNGSVSIQTITETTDINTNQSTFTIPAKMTTSGETFNNDDAYMTLQWKYASDSEWTTISKKTFGISKESKVTKSWSLTLTHKSDGTLENVNFRVKWYITNSTNGTTGTTTKTPTTIPRASDIDSITNGTTPYNPTIVWTPKNSSFKYKVEFLNSINRRINLSYIIVPNQTTPYTYDSLEVNNNSYNNVDSITQTMTAILYTYKSDDVVNPIGTKTKTFTTTLNPNIKPTISISNLAEVDETMQSLNWGIYVKGKSKLSYKINYSFPFPMPSSATLSSNTNGQNFNANASIDEYTQTQTFITNTLSTVGTNTITARATDSRTRYTDATPQTYTVVDYSNPTVSTAQIQRCDANGNITNEGEYCYISYGASISSCENNNKANTTYKVGYRVHNTGDYNYIPLTTNVNSYSASGVLYTDGIYPANRGTGTKLQLSTSNTYDIQFFVEDSFTETTNVQLLDTGFDLMNFNSNGKAMAIGKVSEATGDNKLLEIALPTTYSGTYIKDDLAVENIKSKNMFDKNFITKGLTYNSTGGTTALTNAFVQYIYIPVKPNTTYTLGTTTNYTSETDYRLIVCEYNSSKTFIQRNLGQGSKKYTITTTANTYYVRLCASTITLDELQFEKGSEHTTYSNYEELGIDALKEKELVVGGIRSKNMFDKNNVIHNCRFGASGEEIYDSSGTSGTYYIEVEPSTTYAISHGIDWAQVVCLYDSSKTFIQRFNYGGGRTFTTTSATKYVRISVYDTNLDTFQLEKGSSSTTYYPYQNLNPLTPNGIFAGVSGSGTIYVDITTFTTLTLSQVIQVGNFFEISNGGIKCLRTGTIEVSGKIHIQSPASSNAVRWLEIHNGNTQIAVFPSAVTARTTLTSPTIISNVSANDIIYLKYDGVSGDRLRGNKEYTSLYVKYIN